MKKNIFILIKELKCMKGLEHVLFQNTNQNSNHYMFVL